MLLYCQQPTLPIGRFVPPFVTGHYFQWADWLYYR